MAVSIMRSITDNNAQRLTKLLRYGAGLKITADDLSTGLIAAIKHSRVECVDSLLKAGADANTADDEGKPALYVLMEHGRGNPEILKALLQMGANPNKVTWATQQTALHAAARRGYQVCIKQLVLAGANVSRQDSVGYTPLMYSAREGHITILRALLAENADPNIVGNQHESALHLAVKGRHNNCVYQLLCQAGDPNITDVKGQTPLLLAIKDDNEELIDMLLEHKASVNAQDKTTGKTILHLAIESGNLSLIIKLLQRKADPNIRDKDWQTPFLTALNMGRRDIMEHLLRAGCKIAATDRSFNTPLHIASLNGQADMIHLFIERGLDVNLKGSGGMTPIMLASLGAHTKTVQILLQYGANSSLTDRNHASALAYAIISNAPIRKIYDVVKVLIKSNCDVDTAANLHKIMKTFTVHFNEDIDVEPHRLYSPLELAYLRGDSGLFMMLIRAGCDMSSFHCDKDASLQSFKSLHSDLNNKWLLLRCLKKEKQRIKSLRELCRRPLLKAFGGKLSMAITSLPVSEQMKRFLLFADVDEVCEEYSSELEVEQSPCSPTSPKQQSFVSPFARGQRIRSTIHLASGTTRRRSNTQEPTTPILPKASWDTERKTPSTPTGTPKLKPSIQRSSSLVTNELSTVERRRIQSASNVPPEISPPYSPNPEDTVEEYEDRPKVGFFQYMKPKKKSSNDSHASKARSKRARDPRETINMLLHGSSEEYTSSGEITPRPLDMASIEALSEIDKSPQEDYASVNKMLYGKSLRNDTPIPKEKQDMSERIRAMRKETLKQIEAQGVEDFINSDTPAWSLTSQLSDFNSKMQALTNGYTSENKTPHSASRPFKLKSPAANRKPRDRYPNGDLISPDSTPGVTRKTFAHGTYAYKDRQTATPARGASFNHGQRSFSTSSPHTSVNRSVTSRERYSSLGDSYHADSEASYGHPYTGNGVSSPTTMQNSRMRPPSLDISHANSNTSQSLLSPTSNTDSYDSSGSSSAAAYTFPSGDAQLMQKYLTSQDSGLAGMDTLHYNGNAKTHHSHHGVHTNDLNGNSGLSESALKSRNRTVNHDRSNMNSSGRVRTSSVSSTGSTSSRVSQGSKLSTGNSRIPVIQHNWTPSPTANKCKLPVPVKSPYTASSRGFGNFVRSQSVRKW